MEPALKIEIDLNVLNHLGIGLYSNTPAVLTEIVSNAWDADSSIVDIEIQPDLINILDNGHGMSRADLQKKFLTVGYARRKHGEEFTRKGKPPAGRQCMGRKGIGKLAMFSLADEIHLVTREAGAEPTGFVIDVPTLKKKIEDKEAYEPGPIVDFSPYSLNDQGTLISLRKLQKDVNKTEAYLRRRIARRFSVLGGGSNFEIRINGVPVTLQDRGFYSDIQFLWIFGPDVRTQPLCTHVKKVHNFDGITPSGHQIKGFIAGVLKPEMLRRDGDNNNTITLLANGRIFDEDVQKRIDDSRVFNSYLVGELEFDVLDVNDQEDVAVSSRQGVQENDPRFQEFIGYIRGNLSKIANFWDEWRRELGAENAIADFPGLTKWLETLGKHRKKAEQLINKTNVMRFTGTEVEQKSQRREVLKGQILAFEKLKFQDNLDAIDSIDIEKNAADFREIMITVEDLEASLHRDIVQQRLAVIRKLELDQSGKVKEIVVQEHIYKHLWLVDSKWEHKEHETDWEKTLTEFLKAACPDSDDGARLDIGYRTTAGRYIVIELKRPGLKVVAQKLLDQGERYVMALTEYFSQNPGSTPTAGSGTPPIDVVFIVDSQPALHALHDKRLQAMNGRILTYKDIVLQARIAYEDYLKASAKIGSIREVIESL